MSSSNSSSTPTGKTIIFYGEHVPVKLCLCHREMVFKTHWDKDDPGRRYHECPTHGPRRCGLREWYDPPMCEQAKKIIPALLRKLDGFKRQKVENEREANSASTDQSETISRYKARVKDLKLHNLKLIQEFADSTRMYRWILAVLFACWVATFMSMVKT